jgi:D-3-phosphoglycerate dehydrogenase
MSQKHVVAISCRFDQEALAYLQTQEDLEIRQIKGDDLPKADLSQVEAMIIRSKVRIDDAFLQRTPKLKMVVTATSGFDHIDFVAADIHEVSVYFAPDGNMYSAAELTWSLILACARKLFLAHKSLKLNDWKRTPLLGLELTGKTYGIIGLGRIGTTVSKIARGFGMNVVAYDPYVDDDVFVSHEVSRVGFEELMRTSDVISLHVPYTKETRYMINRKTMKWLEGRPILVNTSRGPVVNEQDLVDALKEGKFWAVGLDVFEKEPLQQSSGLWSREDAILVPHVGATTFEAFQRSSLIAAEKVVKHFNKKTVEDILPPRKSWAEHILFDQ